MTAHSAPSTPHTTSPSHLEFGPLLVTRKPSVLWLFFGGLCWLGAIATAALIVWGSATRLQLHRPIYTPTFASFAMTALVFAVPGWLLVRHGRRWHEFYEKGAVARRGRRVLRALPYADVTVLRYKLTRQYYNGVYIGTSLHFDLRSADGTRVCYNGRYKEKAKGFGFFGIGKTFESNEELDAIKLRIATGMANRWAIELSNGMPLTWCSGIALTPEGLLPARGRFKGQPVPFTEVERFAVVRGVLKLFCKDQQKPFASANINDRNFWPGFVLLSKIWSAKDESPADNPASKDDAPDDELESETDDLHVPVNEPARRER